MPAIPSNIFGIMNTGAQGLFASQTGVRVAGNNIANVNTEGYSRQRVIYDPSAFGNGVNVKTIQQVRNQFVAAQLKAELETSGLLRMRSQLLGQMEQIFDETSGIGISSAMSEFFAALQDLTSIPDGTAQRESVRSRGSELSTIFNSIRGRLAKLREAADKQVIQSVATINTLAKQIADVNAQIIRQREFDQEPLELLDQRERLLNELSEQIDIDILINEDNLATVFVTGGQPLVEGIRASELKTVIDPTNEGLRNVILDSLTGLKLNITGKVKGGELAAALEVRDKTTVDQMRQLDKLAAQFITLFNIQHRAGTGLDGGTDRDFFDPVSVFSQQVTGNQGGVTQTGGAILDQSQLTFDDYEIRFTDPNTVDIVNVSTGATVASGMAYVSGGAISFDGLSITLSSVNGPPVAGDVLRVNTFGGASGNMGLSADIQAGLEAIGAGLSAEPGDNRNALDLAALEEALILAGGSATFEDVYNGQITSLGIMSQRAGRDFDNQDLIVQQVRGLNDAISGVSLDEESTRLIQFERAFQANSRVIVAVDEMLETLVNLV